MIWNMDWEAKFCLYQLWKPWVILSIHFPVKIFQVCDLNFLTVPYTQSLPLIFSTCPCERWVHQKVHYGCSLSPSLSLSPFPLSLLKVTTQHITVILLSTFQPAHPPGTCWTTLGEITSHPRGVLHAGEQTPGWQSSSPQTPASSPSVNTQSLLLCIGSRVTVAFDSLSSSWETTLSAEQAESYQMRCFSWIGLPAEAWKRDLQPPTMSCALFPLSLVWLTHSGNCPPLLLCSPNTRWVPFKLFYF